MQQPSDRAAFKSIALDDWRQFDHVHIEMHPRLTILTGANGSGKSTILGLLGKHFNWSRTYSGAPRRIGAREVRWSNFGRRRRRSTEPAEWQQIGRIEYYNGGETELRVPSGTESQRNQYDVQLASPQVVNGLFIPSHRYPSGAYANVASLPALFGGSEQLFEQFTNESRARWLGGNVGRPPLTVVKESLIAAAVFGEGNKSVDPNPDAEAVWTGFQRILGGVLPDSLGFRRLRVRMPDVIVETATGDFLLDEVSGGLSALVEVSWQLFLRSRNEDSFTVLLDEPENHLHPKLQREVVPNLLRAFPKVQFVVSTHSPFVVTATSESHVYVLDYNEKARVTGRQLDYANKAASADMTLRQVLGLESTMPVWAERRFELILERYLPTSLTQSQAHQLRAELDEIGLAAEFPRALESLLPPPPKGERH